MSAFIYGALLRTLDKQPPYQGEQAASWAIKQPEMCWDGESHKDSVRGTAETGSPLPDPSYLLSMRCLSPQVTQFPHLVPCLSLLLVMSLEDSSKIWNTPWRIISMDISSGCAHTRWLCLCSPRCYSCRFCGKLHVWSQEWEDQHELFPLCLPSILGSPAISQVRE